MIRRFLNRKLTRQELFRSLGRYMALGVLALLAAWMLRRRSTRGASKSATACGYDLPCQQCAELASCRQAKASAARRAARKDRA